MSGLSKLKADKYIEIQVEPLLGYRPTVKENNEKEDHSSGLGDIKLTIIKLDLEYVRLLLM